MNANINNTTIVTVTSVAGQPSFTLPGCATARDIAAAVKSRFGKRVVSCDGVCVAMPHNFNARVEGPQANEVEDGVPSKYLLAQLALSMRSPGSRRWACC